jgi:hypothetical protein
LLEYREHPFSYFVTLTYNDESLPDNKSLDKRDAQLWLKRFRKLYPSGTIRYFLVGEYGEKTMRPHYHAVLFTDREILVSRENRPGSSNVFYWHSDDVSSTWHVGCRTECVPIFSRADGLRIVRYVAGYVVKKLNKRSVEALGLLNIDPEFSIMSRRPGIGVVGIGRIVEGLKAANISPTFVNNPLDVDIDIGYMRFDGKHYPVADLLQKRIRDQFGGEREKTEIEHERTNQGFFLPSPATQKIIDIETQEVFHRVSKDDRSKSERSQI